jgi:hypothetical protein
MEFRMRPANVRLTALMLNVRKHVSKVLGIDPALNTIRVGGSSQHVAKAEAIFFVPVVQ